MTALHFAARGGHEKVVRFLVENGTDIDIEVKNENEVSGYITKGTIHVYIIEQ